jgi:CDP-4-dehydro-6-deoxyglucose reductase, E3
LNRNIKLPFSCRSGVCGTCKAKVLQGKVNTNNKVNHVLTESDKNNNTILTCQAEAISDLLVLEMLSPVSKQVDIEKPKEMISEILSIKQVTLKIKDIKLSVSKRFTFIPDKLSYIEIIIPGSDIKEKYYILYNNKNDINYGYINILIDKRKNLHLNKYLNNTLIIGEIITIKGPYLDKNSPSFSDKPTLFLSKNINIIKTLNIINELLATGYNHPIMLISYFDDKKDILLMEEMHKLQFLYKNFSYKITLLNKDPSSTSRFLFGNIAKNINKIFPDLGLHYIYVNGDNEFLIESNKKLIELGSKEENIYTDKNN